MAEGAAADRAGRGHATGRAPSGILDQAKGRARTMLRVQTYALAGSLVGKGLGCAFLDAYTAAGLNPQAVVVLRLEPRIGFRWP